MQRDTGSPRIDAEHDFLRVRRNQLFSRLGAWMRRDSEDVGRSLSFDEVVAALGLRGESFAGLQTIPLEAIVGSVDRVRDFDSHFRPTTARSRMRWERTAEAARRGEPFPPIDVYKLGDLYFVRDGHHRVSVSRAQGNSMIEAYVTEVQTALSPVNIKGRKDLYRKQFRRVFLERVPLTGEARKSVRVSDPWRYAVLAEMVEAWATRTMHAEKAYMDTETMAQRWYDEEYRPTVELIRSARLIDEDEDETEPDAYMRVSRDRYRLIRRHAWDAEVLELLQGKARKPAPTAP